MLSMRKCENLFLMWGYVGIHAALLFIRICLFSFVTAIAEMIRGVDVDTSYQSPNATGGKRSPLD